MLTANAVKPLELWKTPQSAAAEELRRSILMRHQFLPSRYNGVGNGKCPSLPGHFAVLL